MRNGFVKGNMGENSRGVI